MSRVRTMTGRDQAVSAFSAILLRLCDAAQAVAAAVVDAEGETVDYAGSVDPFDIKVAAAELQLVVTVTSQTPALDLYESQEIVMRGKRKSFALFRLGEGYSLVLQLLPHAFGVSQMAVAEGVRAICAEAGLELPSWLSQRESWTRVEVQTCSEDRRRPEALWLGRWCAVDVLGRYQDPDWDRGVVGFRARLETGAELSLLREPLGYWYVDALPAS